MTTAQGSAFAVLRDSGELNTSNEGIWEALGKMPDQKGTYKEVIEFMSHGLVMTAAEGNALSAPIIRALSEGARLGVLDASQSITNTETGKTNTVYRLRPAPGVPNSHKQTWKDRALALEAKFEELKAKYETACASIDRLEARLTQGS